MKNYVLYFETEIILQTNINFRSPKFIWLLINKAHKCASE